MELQVIEQNAIVQAFQTQGGTDALFERIAEQARSFVPDVTTDKGRKAIGSLAAKVSSSKKLAERYALDLVADQKAQIKVVDTDRIQFCNKMDALRDEILAPRDAYVKAEEDRKAKHEALISVIRMPASLAVSQDAEWTALNIKEAIETLENRVIDSSFEEYEQEAKIAKFETLEALRTALAAREKYEAEQAELEALRQAEVLRQQQERDAQIAREATEKAEHEAKQREAQLRVEKEAAELREQQLKIQAEQQAKQAEIDKQEAIKAERIRLEIQIADQAEADRKDEEAHLANVEHRRAINREAFDAIQALCLGIPEAQIKELIGAIAKNQVPYISIKY